MQKITLLLSAIILLSLAGTQTAAVDANPIPKEPITPCILEVSSPTETTYANEVPLVFTAREPDVAWNPCANPGIGTVFYVLDGERSENLFVSSGKERGPLHFSLNLTDLSEGAHTLTIFAQVHGLMLFGENPSLTMSEPYTNQTIHFTIDKTQPTQTNTPTPNPTPTFSPTTSPTEQTPTSQPPQTSYSNVSDIPIALTTIAIVILAVTSISLFYLRRKKNMKKTKAIYSLFLVAAMLVGALPFEVASANPYPPAASKFLVTSPQPYTSYIYQNDSVSLTVELDLLVDDATGATPQITHVTYSLDGKANVTSSAAIPKTGREYTEPLDLFGRSFARYVAIVNNLGTLGNLTDGRHTVYVYAFDSKGGVMSTGGLFEVLTTYKIPEVKILSPTDQVNTNEVPLTCIIKGNYTQLCYAIDYLRTGCNVSIQGNTTVSVWGLRNGEHELRVYATNPGCYGGSDVVLFTKNCSATDPTSNPTSTPSPTQTPAVPNPTATATPTATEQTPTSEPARAASNFLASNIAIAAIALAIALLVVASTCMVYFRRRRGKP
jgi:hypothetical protein